MNEANEFFSFFYFFVWVPNLSSSQTRPWQPRHSSIISGGRAVRPSHGLQYGHTNWCGGHTVVKLSTCQVSGIFYALTAADLWRVARGWITRSGESVFGRDDRVQLTSYSMDAGVFFPEVKLLGCEGDRCIYCRGLRMSGAFL